MSDSDRYPSFLCYFTIINEKQDRTTKKAKRNINSVMPNKDADKLVTVSVSRNKAELADCV